MTAQLAGKVALVTGAGSGIGRASAVAFAQAGAAVVVADVAAAAGAETVALIRAAGGTAEFACTDVSRGADVAALVNRAVALFGRLDCAHNNAGVEGSRTAPDDEDDWDRTIDINLKGIFLCQKYEIAQMLGQGGGAIVNTSSIAGLRGRAGGNPAYVASKHGIVGLTRWAALTYAKQGIRVNAVCPGTVETPMIERIHALIPPEAGPFRPSEPIGRTGKPAEIAAAVVWLCSDAASFVTGHAMSVDGGRGAQ